MAARAPSQVRVETLVARGRSLVAFFAVLAGPPTLPAGYGHAAVAVAIIYCIYAVTLLALMRTRLGGSPRLPGATHAIDLAAYTVYVSVASEASLAVLAWFLFALVAATLRWGWRGALTTGSVGIAVHVVFGAESSSLRAGGAQPLQFIMIALLMGVMT